MRKHKSQFQSLIRELKIRTYVIIFRTHTRAGRLFDLVLLASIVLSILLVMLESMSAIRTVFAVELLYLEWVLTLLFTFEYTLRVFSSPKPRNYTLSFLGVIDFIALLPTYLSIFVSGTHFFVVIRAIRLLRVFRILKLTRYLTEASIIGEALIASQKKILVFLMGVVSLVTIMGTIMYMIEGAENGFTSIPISIYWAIVTVTTVGYGDISPQTPLGQFVASLLMLMGYAIIAVPTGIVTAELTNANAREQIKNLKICPNCRDKSHMLDAVHCKTCGEVLIG